MTETRKVANVRLEQHELERWDVRVAYATHRPICPSVRLPFPTSAFTIIMPFELNK